MVAWLERPECACLYFKLFVQGIRPTEVSRICGIGREAPRVQVNDILRKLGVTSGRQLLTLVAREGVAIAWPGE